jgi:hypothetical protein
VSNIYFKSELKNIFLSNLRQWTNDNLTENLIVKQLKILNEAWKFFDDFEQPI